MNPTLFSLKSLGFVLCAALLIAAGPATKPSATPTSKPTMGPDTSIAKDQYHFPAPPVSDWAANKADPDAESIIYTNTAQDGQIALQLLPRDASVSDSVAVAVVKELKKEYADKKTVMVMAPKVEHDKRFGIVVHEKYKAGDKTVDTMHIYKSVGPRVLMLLVSTSADDADKVKDIQTAAEEMLDQAKFNRKAFKKGE